MGVEWGREGTINEGVIAALVTPGGNGMVVLLETEEFRRMLFRMAL